MARGPDQRRRRPRPGARARAPRRARGARRGALPRSRRRGAALRAGARTPRTRGGRGARGLAARPRGGARRRGRARGRRAPRARLDRAPSCGAWARRSGRRGRAVVRAAPRRPRRGARPHGRTRARRCPCRTASTSCARDVASSSRGERCRRSRRLSVARTQAARQRGPDSTIVISWTEGPASGFDLDGMAGPVRLDVRGPALARRDRRGRAGRRRRAPRRRARATASRRSAAPPRSTSRRGSAARASRSSCAAGPASSSAATVPLWVVGHRVDLGAAITHETRSIAYLTVDVRPTTGGDIRRQQIPRPVAAASPIRDAACAMRASRNASLVPRDARLRKPRSFALRETSRRRCRRCRSARSRGGRRGRAGSGRLGLFLQAIRRGRWGRSAPS